MTTPIETNFVKSYSQNIDMLLQQRMSKLRAAVSEEHISGEEAFFDQIGPVEALDRTGEFNDLEPTQSPHDRRRVTFVEKYRSEYVGEMSKLRTISDPTSAYANNSMFALNRAIDRIIVDAAFATAYTGKNGTVPVSFPTTQRIAHGGTGLTVEKLIEARELLDAAENDDQDERTLVVSARQVSNLLATTQATSADYNSVRALVAGQIDTFLGFKFVRYEGLPLAAPGIRRTVAFVKSGIKLGVAKNATTSADWVPTKRAYLLYAGLAMGATRMQEAKIVEIECKE